MSIRKYTVLVDDGAGVSIQALARQLEEHGFVVETQLEAIGVMVGRVDEQRLPGIRAIRGVAAIEEEREVGL